MHYDFPQYFAKLPVPARPVPIHECES